VSTGRQLARFAAVGALGFLVDAAVLYSVQALGSGWHAGRLLSFLAAVLFTWQFNRRFTFTAPGRDGLWAEGWRYLSAMGLGGIANLAAYALMLFLAPMTPWTPLAGVAAGSVAGMLVNFTMARNWVFR
jgi:putative flippase GtrA